ncbi:peptide-N-glycosidase F-related protein [Lysobacter sp. CA199]|uniref:peptide-N-glycosidase F-related protein n=1 Tax=Lysobacter sp. CA199 TaxID=3455608 RepID=UPI003F8D850F
MGTLAVSIAGYGASSGGQEYTNTNISVKVNGNSLATFSTKIDCASYEQFSPRGNPGIFRNNNTSNPRSWCPGALVPMRYFDLGDIAGKTIQVTLGVGNPSPWTSDSQYVTSVSVLEH